MEIDQQLRIAAFVVTGMGAIAAVWKYFDQKRIENELRRLDTRKIFLAKQQEVYFQLLTATAVLSTRLNEDKLPDAFNDFWIMFWGPVPVVADEEVARAVDRFADALDHPDDGIQLRNTSMDLARACRKSLGEAWRADFEPYIKSRLSGLR